MWREWEKEAKEERGGTDLIAVTKKKRHDGQNAKKGERETELIHLLLSHTGYCLGLGVCKGQTHTFFFNHGNTENH